MLLLVIIIIITQFELAAAIILVLLLFIHLFDLLENLFAAHHIELAFFIYGDVVRVCWRHNRILLRLFDGIKYLLSTASWRHPRILSLKVDGWLYLIGLPFDSIFLETCLVQKSEALVGISWTAAWTLTSTFAVTFVKVAFTFP